ncbi:MAG: MBL fold metallo-hydrolase [Saccharolobus sp.]|jgi:L-ascorbate metabolism protein UlaG (beta-lactamase superfamily)|uniref:MBL fold metallo-hydrolase n=1 Tax=Saccharolobus sp. TaxID=2100761 RepID=UPI0028CD8389|nr:MBL fold metallo-hydrolase [Saccharolobus sp.]MDT7860675.1 MBL fold metallo-hydrolase [Saccharolobus sp.]
MLLKFFGHSCILIDNKILIDPHDGGSIGLPKPPINNADLILITHDHYDHNAYQIVQYKDVKINFYGSFTYDNYTIKGIKTYHDKYNGKLRGENSVYIIEKNGKKIVHLGDIGHLPNEKLYEEISEPDVLLIPIGGVITINYKEAIEIINKVNPRILVPIHYWIKGHYMPLDPPDDFISNINYKIKYLDFKNNEINEEIENNTKVVYIIRV